jgi:hypothetical protein
VWERHFRAETAPIDVAGQGPAYLPTCDIRRRDLQQQLYVDIIENSEIEGRQKSRLRAYSVVYVSRRRSKACERVARSKPGRSAEPLRKPPLRLPAVF